MSTQEFLGVTLGLILAIATAFFTLLGYKIAMKRKFHQMRRCLELASACSIMGWLVMTVVVYKYDREYTVLQQAKAFVTEPETRIVGQGISKPQMYAVETKSGARIEWDNSNAGLRSGTSSIRSGGGSIRRSDGSGRYRVGISKFPFARIDVRDNGSDSVSAESNDATARF